MRLCDIGICWCTCTHMYVCTCLHLRMDLHELAHGIRCVYVHAYIQCIYAYIYIYIYIHIRTHIQVGKKQNMQDDVYTRLCVWVYVCIFRCIIYICVCTYACVCIHIHIHRLARTGTWRTFACSLPSSMLTDQVPWTGRNSWLSSTR